MSKNGNGNGFIQRISDCFEYGVDVNTRTVYVVGELEEDKGHKCVALFQMLDSTPGDIRVVIISEGGYEQAGYALYDAIRLANNEVTTVGFGHVHSIAAVIFQAGHLRLLAPECSFMIHNGSIELGPGDMKSNEVISLGKEAEMNNGRYHEILRRHSGRPMKEIQAWCHEEKYFSAEEAVSAGFADAVMPLPERKKK